MSSSFIRPWARFTETGQNSAMAHFKKAQMAVEISVTHHIVG